MATLADELVRNVEATQSALRESIAEAVHMTREAKRLVRLCRRAERISRHRTAGCRRKSFG